MLRALRVSLPPTGLDRRQWLNIAAAALLLALLAAGTVAHWTNSRTARPAAAPSASEPIVPGATPPPAEPLQFREMAPEDAMAINAAIPVAGLPNPAASPFILSAMSEADRLRAVTCLASAIYYEAAHEGVDGQRGVAQVVLNRVRHPAFPSTVCGVVYQGAERATGCQFTFTCDGSLGRTPARAGWEQARRVAEAALAGYVHAPVGWATHYHANYVVPYWSSSLVKLANIGAHIFYRWTGGWGTAPAFASRHFGVEPEVARIAHLMPAAADLPQIEPLLGDALMDSMATATSPVPEVEPATPDEAPVTSFGSTVLRRPAAAPAAQAAPPPASYRSALTRMAPTTGETMAATHSSQAAAR